MVSATAKRTGEMLTMLPDNFVFRHYGLTSIILDFLLWTAMKIPKAYGITDFHV